MPIRLNLKEEKTRLDSSLGQKKKKKERSEKKKLREGNANTHIVPDI